MVTQPQALAVAGGAVLLTLYNRRVIQDAWGALGGPLVPFLTPTAQRLPTGAPPVLPGDGPPDGTGDPPPSIFPGGNDALAKAEQNVSGEKSYADWVNWCLQFVDDVRTRLGEPTSRGAGGGRAYSAHDACAQQTLHGGPAPRGASVCFSGNPGHIGISNGGCQYTSAGLSPGGIQVRDYCGNSGYIGWFSP